VSGAPTIGLDAVRDLVCAAGRDALRHWGAVASEAKDDKSLVTEVDRSVENRLAEGIGRLYPDAAFAGEEFGRRGDGTGDIWICDPVDGTTNFVTGLPHWCVSLGLLRDGRPHTGVIYAPALDRLYWAQAGAGAYCNGSRLRATGNSLVEHEDLLCISTNSIKTLQTAGIEARLRCLGSIALELALVAEGKAIGSVGLHEGIVDVAAALCLLAEAGAEVAYLDGEPIVPLTLLSIWRTRKHFLGSSPTIREAIVTGLRGA
jgi:myo-inositol-1(or 4)-monophosphatase